MKKELKIQKIVAVLIFMFSISIHISAQDYSKQVNAFKQSFSKNPPHISRKTSTPLQLQNCNALRVSYFKLKNRL
jgi:hypothetical protein